MNGTNGTKLLTKSPFMDKDILLRETVSPINILALRYFNQCVNTYYLHNLTITCCQ